MKPQSKIALVTCVLALGAAPALAHGKPEGSPPYKLPPGQACKGMSKKHVKDEKGTAFSRCVDGVAKLRREEHRKEREEAEAQA